MDNLKKRRQANRNFWKALAKKSGKSIKQLDRELVESRRCEWCGAHGHQAKNCPAKAQS